jgi:DNA-directed RNA polymerase specialized sigma24 family protein
MKEEDGHRAGELLKHTFGAYYPEIDPEELHRLGKGIFSSLDRRVRSEHLAPDLAWDIFQVFFVNCLKHLDRHGAGSVIELGRWARTVARNAAYHFIMDLRGNGNGDDPVIVLSLEELLDGDAEYHLPSPPLMWHSEEELEALLLAAIDRLEGRHREFARRHFLHRESREDIKRAMELPSDRSFARLYRQTVRFLVDVVKDLLAHTVAAAWMG